MDVPEEFTGTVIDKLSQRKGELRNMGVSNGGYTRLEFLDPCTRSDRIPRRIYDRYQREMVSLNTVYDGYAPYKGDIQYRKQGFSHCF